MSIVCKLFPNQVSATNAANAGKPSWVAPSYSLTGGGRHVDPGTLPPQEMTGPSIPLVSTQWAVVASHPGFQSDTIEPTDIDFTLWHP